MHKIFCSFLRTGGAVIADFLHILPSHMAMLKLMSSHVVTTLHSVAKKDHLLLG